MTGPNYLPPRPWTQRKDSFSSLVGLEIAIPPSQKAPLFPGASLYSEYSDKALPPIPLKSNRRRSRLSYEEMDRDDLSSLTSRTSKSSRKVFQLMGVHVDTDTKDPPRSQSRMSVSSLGSEYSDDDLEDDYSTTPPASVTPPPRRPSSVDDLKALKKKGMLYLQAVTYSASASKIQRETSKSKSIPNQLKTEPLPLRQKDRVQSASPQPRSESRNGGTKPPRPKSPVRSQTLDDMIAYERRRYNAEELARKMWKPTIGRPEPRTLEDRVRSPTPKMENSNSAVGYPYVSASRLTPPRLVFGGREDRRQSTSHFSDQSDDEIPGIMANARDSVMSHLRRNVKSPSPTAPAYAISHAEKHKSPARLMPPPATKRKRLSSKGKHPIKSPFPFQNNHKNKKQQWPVVPIQHHTKSTTPSFSKRLSGVMRRFSAGSGSLPGQLDGSPLQSSTIITTEVREVNGPDTPMPTSSSSNKNKMTGMGFKSNIKLSSPKFMKDLTTAGIAGEKTMSGKEILEKGSMRFADAIESAKKKAGVKSKAEKRRDHIRANIVKIGQADQFPDGRVNRWL